MLYDPNRDRYPGGLEDTLRAAKTLTPDLLSEVIAETCTKIGSAGSGKKTDLARIVESGAPIEAALGLVELEHPDWRVRRLIYDEGNWICALSRHPALPFEFDDIAEGRHGALPLAILVAFVQACRAPRDEIACSAPAALVPACGVCCDNFI